MTDAKHLRRVLPDRLGSLSLRIGLSDVYKIIRVGDGEYRISTADSGLYLYFDSIEDAPMDGLFLVRDGVTTGRIMNISMYNTCVEWRA